MLKPYLSESTGKFTPPSTDEPSTSGATPNNPRKRADIESPPSLLPATKTARLQQEKMVDCIPEIPDNKAMDAQIAQHFLACTYCLMFGQFSQ
jgi:hypothetical protein